MALTTYSDVRNSASAIQEAVQLRRMPPWFADPDIGGPFENAPHLPDGEVRLISEWIAAGALAGKVPRPSSTGTPLQQYSDQGQISANLSVAADRPFTVAANADSDRQYLVYSLPFTHDRWVRAVELVPSDRSLVHHAILYVRKQQSTWLRNAVPGVPFAPTDPEGIRDADNLSRAEVLAVFAAGTPAVVWPDGMAKRLPSGADLVLQVHYVNKSGVPASDEPQIDLAVQSDAPAKEILTGQIAAKDFAFRSTSDGKYTASTSISLPSNAVLVSMFPSTHLRGGTGFDIDIVARGGAIEPVLKARPNKLNWLSNYVLRTPRPIGQGSLLRWTVTADSANESPATAQAVRCFFDIAISPPADSGR